MMTTFYVATRVRYVLVEADNEAGARIAGQKWPALLALARVLQAPTEHGHCRGGRCVEAE